MRHDALPGFAAPMAALAVALLALGLMMSLPATDRIGREIRQARIQLDVERAAVTAQSHVAFLLLTEPAGRAGIEFGGPRLALDGSVISGDVPAMRRTIYFDGRPYSMAIDDSTDAIIRLQDEGGLINVHGANRAMLADLMIACGVPAGKALSVAADIAAARSVSPESKKAYEWSRYLRGDARRRVEDATSSIVMAKPALSLRTAPPTVLYALAKGDSGSTRKMLDARNDDKKTINMNIDYNQNEYNVQYPSSYATSLANSVRINISIERPGLTGALPFYLHRSTIILGRDDPAQSFIVKGPIIDAGRQTHCFPFVEEAPQPLPQR